MKHYLGDWVYVELDGFRIILTTEVDRAATNRIVLVPEVANALIAFIQQIGNKEEDQ